MFISIITVQGRTAPITIPILTGAALIQLTIAVIVQAIPTALLLFWRDLGVEIITVPLLRAEAILISIRTTRATARGLE